MNASAAFDVFLSYNTLDHVAVERIAHALKERGMTVFLDRWELVPGRSWPDALATHLSKCSSAIVILGPYGMDPWQQREHHEALAIGGRSVGRAYTHKTEDEDAEAEHRRNVACFIDELLTGGMTSSKKPNPASNCGVPRATRPTKKHSPQSTETGPSKHDACAAVP